MADENCARVKIDFGSSRTPEFAANKRPRSSPTLCTPYREEKRIPLRHITNHCNESTSPKTSTLQRLTPRTLISCASNTDGTSRESKDKWTDDELKALTEFVLFHTSGESWPARKLEDFWKSAGEFIHQRLGLSTLPRSGRY